MTDPIPPLLPEDREKLRQLDQFAERVQAAEDRLDGKRSGLIGQVNRDSGLAWRVMVDIVAGPAVGMLVGYLADQHFGTSPGFILAGFFLGVGGGFMNAYKTATGKGSAVGLKNPKK